jgi:hypothetical protein
MAAWVSEIWVRVCRGVLRFWGMRIQDSRTDFWSKTGKFVDSASTRGWCKIETIVGNHAVDGLCVTDGDLLIGVGGTGLVLQYISYYIL